MKPRLWAALCMLVAMQSSGAGAQVFEVIHPEIEAGGFEFESLNGVSLVDVEDGEERSAHEIALSYAPFSFWKPTAAIEIANPEGEDAEVEAFELENVFLLPFGTGHGDHHGHDHDEGPGFALGLFVGWEVPNEGGVDESTVSFGPIGEVGIGPASVIANFFVEVPVDDDVDPGLAYALAASVPVAEAISLGFEAHGDVEQAFGDAPDLDDTEHYIGPAAFLDLDLGRERVLEPRLAMLFGLTEGSSDAVLSLNFELKF